MELMVRFDYGSIVPWVRRAENILLLTAGPDTLELSASVDIEPREYEERRNVLKCGAGARHVILAQLPSIPRGDSACRRCRTQALARDRGGVA